MTLDEIIAYVRKTPENTNPAVLATLIGDAGGGGSNIEAFWCPITLTFSGLDAEVSGAVIATEEGDGYLIEPTEGISLGEEPVTLNIVGWSTESYTGLLPLIVYTEGSDLPTLTLPAGMLIWSSGGSNGEWSFDIWCENLVPGTTYAISGSEGTAET